MPKISRKATGVWLTDYLGVPVTVESLEQHASRGTGPEYSLVFGKAVYDTEKLKPWADAQLKVPRKRRLLTKRRSAGASSVENPVSLAAKSAAEDG